MKEFEIIYHPQKGFSKQEIKEISELQDGEVLIRPKKIGVCGSDFFYMNKYQGESLRLGHEWIGVVEKSNSKKFKENDMVTSCALIGCGKCEFCLDGKENKCVENFVIGSEDFGMLRSICKFHENNLIKIENMDLDTAALLEVAGIGYAVIHNLEAMGKIDDQILILGAGSVGIMSAIVAKEKGYDVVLVDTEINRVKKAAKLGFEAKILPMQLQEKSKFKFIADCTGDSNGKTGGWKYLTVFSEISAKCLIVGHYENELNFDSHVFGKFTLEIRWMKGMSKEVYQNSIKFFQDKLPSMKDEIIASDFSIDEVDKAFDYAKDLKNGFKTIISL